MKRVSASLISSGIMLLALSASAEGESVGIQGLTIFSFCCFLPPPPFRCRESCSRPGTHHGEGGAALQE